MPFSGILRLFRLANSRKADIARTIAADSKRSFWALADQGVVSLGNFGINIVLYKSFERMDAIASFGDFWTLMELMLSFNLLQAALIVYPLTVRGATTDRAGLSAITAHSLIFTTVTWPVALVGMLLTALLWKIPLIVGLWAGIAILCWQFQETARRALMAHLRFRAALVGDVVTYFGQVTAIAFLAWSGRLTLLSTFQVICVMCSLGWLIQWLQVGWRRRMLIGIGMSVTEGWKLGCWVLTGNLVSFAAGPAFNWNIRYWVGDELLGISYALSNLLRPVNPLMFAIASMIVPMAAHAHRDEGTRRALKVMLRFSLLGALMVGPYLLFLVVFPRTSIAIWYGWDSRCLDWTLMLQLTAIAAGLTYLATVSGAFLNAVRHSRKSLVGQIVYTGTGLLVGIPLTALMGLHGAAIGWLAASGLQLLIHSYYISILPDEPAAPQETPAASDASDAQVDAVASPPT